MSTHEAPLVSIITPVLNGERYLETCLHSVLEQSYPNMEQIFVDGGSTDRTLEILAHYRRLYPHRIRYISEPDNGIGSATRKGFRLATGDIFGWIDTDDVYEPDAVRTVVDFFNINRNAMLVFGGCNIIDCRGQTLASFIIKDFELQEALDVWNYMVFCATFYRRQLFDAVGYFNDLGNDLDFWIRVDKHFRMYRINKTLANWRQHADSVTMGPSPRARRLRNQRIREDFVLSLKHGGNMAANRPGRYYVIVVLETGRILRPVLGFSYPLLRRCLIYGTGFMDNRMNAIRRAVRGARYPLLTPTLSLILGMWNKVYSGLRCTWEYGGRLGYGSADSEDDRL